MRTTVQIDSELLETLKEQARQQNVSFTHFLNQTLRAGIQAARASAVKKPRFEEKTFSMGTPRLPLDKALALAATLEDEETIQKLLPRK
ncbi:MAG: hypothetical protein U1F76_20080 [Candidatus Competibacteraceae bacterium]